MFLFFGVTMEAEAAMTIHSQCWSQFLQRPNVHPWCVQGVCMCRWCVATVVMRVHVSVTALYSVLYISGAQPGC